VNAIPTRRAAELRSLHIDSIRELPDRLWPNDRTFLSRAYLRSLEECLSDQMDLRYALLLRNDRAMAGAVFQRIDFDHSSAFPNLSGPLLASLARTVRISGVICGNTFASGPHGYWSAPDLEAAALVDWLCASLEHFRAELAPAGRQTLAVVKDLAPGCHAEGLIDSQFRRYDDHPVMTLELRGHWRTMSDYRDDLRRSYRRELRIARERLAGVSRRELRSRDFARYGQRMNELRDQVLARATAVPARKDARCLALLSERLSDRCSVLGYFRSGELLGFNTRFRDRGDFESHYFGMDYQANAAHSLYRNMLYDDIETAITGGFERVHFGRCSHESKSAMGAQPTTLASFVHHPSRLLSKLVVGAALRIGRASWRERHPFKVDTTRPPPASDPGTPSALQ
jgi:hypothetical protein